VTPPAVSALRYDSPQAMDPPAGTAWAAILARVPDGAAVLDVGCSTGSFAVALKRKGCRVTGIEVDPRAAEMARSRCDAVHVGDVAAVLASDALADGAFDVVVAADVLEHLVDPWSVARALRRVVRPGGVVLASLPNVTHASVILELCRGRFPTRPEGLLDDTHLRFFGEASAVALFTQAGYAAAVVDRTRVDPRLTEFSTPLEQVPDAVLAYIDENPNADTYQFIVLARPDAAAVEAAPSAEAPAAPIRNRLVQEVNDLRADLRRYHESSVAREEEVAALQQQLADHHRAALERVRELSEMHARVGRYHASLVEARSELEAAVERLAATDRRLLTAVREADEATIALRYLRARERRRALSRRALVRRYVPPEALRVLYVADRSEAPFRYRCRHGAEQLRRVGVAANVMHVADPGLFAALPSYSVVVLFRLPWTTRVAELVERARAHGATLVFESDDLVFDPPAASLIPFLEDAPAALREDYLDRFVRLRQTFDACDFFLGSTPTLARHAERLGKESFVHPNLVSPEYERMGHILRPARRLMKRPPLLAYLSGSNTHDRDLQAIAGALAEVLGRRPDARLLLCGFVSLPPELEPVADRIHRLGFQDWRVYPWALARADVALAPASVVNDFTDAKSSLKFVEAAVFGVPTVATPTESFRDAIVDGVNGFLATGPAEWVEKTSLALDRSRGRAVGARAFRTVRARFSFDAHRGRLRDLLLPIMGRAAGPAPAAHRLDLGQRPRFGERVRAANERRRQQIALLRDRAASADTALPVWCAPLEPAGCDGGIEEPGDVLRVTDWHPQADLEREADGRWRAVGNDPILVCPPVEIDATVYRYLLVRMQVQPATLPAMSQLFWAGEGMPGFAEGQSVCWPLPSEGALHTHVIDLGETRWPRAGRVRALRFDPLGSPGTIRLDMLAFARDLPQLAARPDARRALANRYLRGFGIECGALQNPLPLPADARVVYVDRLTEPQAREHYPELAPHPLVVPALVGDLHRLPIRDGGVDFCIGNHLLEHARDPIGALGELLRVVRPGGVVFASVPDVGNPLDRSRPVTPLAHLLDDHDPALDRTAADLAHYRESVTSSHPEMSPEERERLLETWIAQRYSIHYHTFDEGSFRAFLEHACAVSGGVVETIVRNRLEDFDEYVAVVRRTGAVAAGSADDWIDETRETPSGHYGRWWYPLYLRVAHLVPVRLRRWARARLGGGDRA
jgi:2-polyprenyl-3-methyl-5-hydroxy-6-metoxy-1,4-benzoquinol methylase/glycosyltransferase involved in cell wall biosynthesis